MLRNGVLDPEPIAGVPEVRITLLGGLLDVLPHPNFAHQPTHLSDATRKAARAISRRRRSRARASTARSSRTSKEIFVAENWSNSPTNFGGRMVFGRDGMLYLADRRAPGARPRAEHDAARRQGAALDARRHGGARQSVRRQGRAICRRSTRSAIAARKGSPCIPTTGELWENEHGPLGGDEINIVRAGKNYGWPLVTYGKNYDGTVVSELAARDGLRVAVHVLGAVDRDLGPELLHGRPTRGVEGQRVRRLDDGRPHARDGPRATHHVRRERPADPARADLGAAAPAHPRRARRGRTACSTC